MGTTTSFRDLLTTLRDPRLYALATDAVQRYISWDEMQDADPLPGLTREETWEVLALLRRFDQVTFPIPTLDGIYFRYNITHTGHHCLEHIRHHCRTDSELHQMLQERDNHQFLVRSRIREAIASCQLDGIVIDQRSAERLLHTDRAPRNCEERIVVNSYKLLQRIEPDASGPLTPELVWDLYGQLTRGVDLTALTRGPVKTNLANSRNPDGTLDAAGTEERLQMICDFANRLTGDEWEPTACKAYMVMSAMAYWHPLPDLNDTIGRHMMRLVAVRDGYPALGYLPTSLMMQRWFDGEMEPGDVRFGTIKNRRLIDNEIDGTPDMLIYLELTTSAIKALREYIDRVRNEEETLRDMLDESERLNYRQQSVLSRALVDPAAEFRISEHQRSYKVVYQTARADLLDLEARGFLKMEQRGRAFVFRPAADLQARVRKGR